MKKAIPLFALLIACITGNAQIASNSSYTRDNKETSSSIIFSYSPQQMATEIMNVVGLKANFEIKEAKVANIEAVISHRQRYILYNPQFLRQVRYATNKWTYYALLAHEIGHHLNGHTIRKGGSSPELELEADEFAGFVLHKLGASLEEVEQVIQYISAKDGSSTHPPRADRMHAIQKGWARAGLLLPASDETVKIIPASKEVIGN